MAEYIEREAIAKLFDFECRGECVVCPHDDRGDCTLMNQLPTADVQPVEHGEWEWSEGGQCSECGFHNSNFGYNYCPNCGAKMRS